MLPSAANILVIGSGPSAYACLTAVTGSEKNIDICLGSFHKSKSQERGRNRLNVKMAKRMESSEGISRDYPSGPRLVQAGTAIRTSFNLGGLSTIWGAALPPIWSPQEVDSSALMLELIEEMHYVSRYFPISRIRTNHPDNINFAANNPEVPTSNRMNQLLTSLLKHSDVYSGISSLAVNEIQGSQFSQKFSAATDEDSKFDRWVADIQLIINSHSGKTNLLQNCRVIELRDIVSADGALVEVKFQKDNGEYFINSYNKVFVAAGCVESFRIISSSGLCPNQIQMPDTQIVYLPVLDFSPRRILRSLKDRKQPLTTFSQIWLRGKTNNDTKYYLQFYELNRSLISSISGIKARLLRIVIPLIRHFTLVGILYLDSALSPNIELSASTNVVNARIRESRSLNEGILKKEILGEAKKARILCFFPLSIKGAPGESAHFGAWAPMGRTTDQLGRFAENSNIHVVDASVLPEILPGPITLFAMANSSRISRQALLD